MHGQTNKLARKQIDRHTDRKTIQEAGQQAREKISNKDGVQYLTTNKTLPAEREGGNCL